MSRTYGEQAIEYIKRYMDELIDEKMYSEAEEIGRILCNIIGVYKRHSGEVRINKQPTERDRINNETATYNAGNAGRNRIQEACGPYYESSGTVGTADFNTVLDAMEPPLR